MMRAVAEVTRPARASSTMVSLNPIMVDGTGMCGGCRVSVGGEHEVRLRRRPGVRRPPGRLRRAERAPARVPRAGSRVAAPARHRTTPCRSSRPADARDSGAESDTHGEEDHAEDEDPDAARRTRTSGRTTSRKSRSATRTRWRCRRPAAASSARTSRASRAARSRSTSPASSGRWRSGDFEGAATLIGANAAAGRLRPRLPAGRAVREVCVLGKKGEPVAIGRLERFVADYAAARRAPTTAARLPPTGQQGGGRRLRARPA